MNWWVKQSWVIYLRERIGPTQEWPRAIRPLILSSTHLNYSQRFTVVCFLLINGIKPNDIYDYLCKKPFFTLDSSAKRHIRALLITWSNERWRYGQWNVYQRKTIKMRGVKRSFND